jgi:U5 small nuclear ribonucleoprotein component
MDLYDEFGNYIGPELSESESEVDVQEEEEEEEDRGMELVAMDSSESRVALYHEKQYFPSAEQVFGEAEVLVEEEDTQALETPLVAPIKEKLWEFVERQVPETTWEPSFLAAMLDHPNLTRHVCVLGHLHHGKTSLLDVMVQQTHPRLNVKKYMDVRIDEKDRGLSIKCRPISLILHDRREKSYLINFMDAPGHSCFADEQAAAIRVSDGAVLVVDVIEGLMLQSRKLLMQIAAECANYGVVLVLNKVDRLITELKLPPNDAYHKIQLIVSEANAVLNAINPQAKSLSPRNGNVIFASAEYGWMFSLETFISRFYPDQFGKLDLSRFVSNLWGDVYFNPQTRKFSKSQPFEESERSFVEFILNPLYKIHSHVLGCEAEYLKSFLQAVGVDLMKKQLQLDPKPLLKLVMTKIFPNSAGLVESVVMNVLDPISAANYKIPSIYTGDLNSDIASALRSCDSSSRSLMVNVIKTYPRPDCSAFDVFGRVYAGVLKPGMKVRVLREGYSATDSEDMSVLEIGRIWVLQGRYRVEISRAIAGNWVLIEGLVSKTATITAIDAAISTQIFRPLSFSTKPLIKIAIEPLNPSELPKLLEGLRKVNQTYPLVITRVEESGEHVIFGSGEIYLDSILYDLRMMFSGIEIKVADPVVAFSETVIDTSAIKCTGETPNKKNLFGMIAEPLDEGLGDRIESGYMDTMNPEFILRSEFQWDILSARSVWAFGPDDNFGPNILLNETFPEDVDQEDLLTVQRSIVQGFQWAVREGPLCDEPIRNVKFKLIEAELSDQLINRSAGQVIPTARRIAYSSFLVANPRLLEPVFFAEIICTAECIEAVQKVLARRRGHITAEAPKPGTPLYQLEAFIPAIDSFGFETDLRTHTQGQAFCMLTFDHWELVPGDPLDKSIVLRPLEPSPIPALAREFMLKTRRRKGLPEDVSIVKFFDDPEVAQSLMI